jgi:hypothetical protein
MPIKVFDMRGIHGPLRERIEAAVMAGGKHTIGLHEAWITSDPRQGGYKVLITGPHGFERMVKCAFDDTPAVIAEQVRQTVED